MTNGEANPETVNSITMLDSFFTNTSVAIKTNHRQSLTQPLVGNSLAIENTLLTNVPIAIQLGTTGATVLAGTTSTAYLGLPSQNLTGYGAGNLYNPVFLSYTNPFRAYPRQASLITASGSYYERSKPQYNNLTSTSFSSVRSGGAVGDGVTDDTTAIQNVINAALTSGNVVFFDCGTYKVTKTIFIPAGSRIVGESYSVILGTGTGFGTSILASTQTIPIVQVGNPGDTGIVEWSDMIVSTQGSTQSGIIIQWNLASPAATPSGMWDVHTRLGGFIGSNFQKAQCGATPSTTVSAAPPSCITAFLDMWITTSASGLYMENVWLWTADHDLDDPSLAQISVFTGRGLLISSTTGPIWL
jgi:glucan 1,3-beta-glucosidase